MDEPQASTWPVSYSVNSQGASPLHVAQATNETDVPAIEPLPTNETQGTSEESAPSAEPEADLLPTTTQDLATASAEGSVAEQPSVPELQVEGGAATLVEDAPAADPVERPWTPSYSVTRQGTSPSHTPVELPQEDSVAEAPIERPWTPSYSVTRQGTNPLLSPQTLEDEAPAEPAPVVDEPEALEDTTAIVPPVKSLHVNVAIPPTIEVAKAPEVSIC